MDNQTNQPSEKAMRLNRLFLIAMVLLLAMATSPSNINSFNAIGQTKKRSAPKHTETETASQPTEAHKPSGHHVKDLNIKVLSTMLADDGIGEWGYAAMVEADGHRILFDTGAREETVWTNAKELNVDLSDVEDVILSHNHSDHTNGLLTLRKKLMRTNRKALTRAYVGEGIFWSRPSKRGGENNDMIALKPRYEALGGKFIEYKNATEIYPGIWLTGFVPRTYPEMNWSGTGEVETPDGKMVEDNIPEDLSLVIDTDEGLVVISGCGHAGIVNTLEHARKTVRNAPILATIGGFHLFENDDKSLDWTADKMKEMGVKNILGGHCTGIEAVYHLREKSGLNRKTCVVSAVGSSFSLDKGLDPAALAK